jgi:hypothetical protein
MSNNHYLEDHQFGTKEYSRLLDEHFYPFLSGGHSPRRFDNDGRHDKLRQTKYKTDLEIELSDGFLHDFEEKIARWPEDGKPHTAFYYETESCSRPGLITPGWMRDSEAEYLMYAFEIHKRGLDIYLSDFQKLKQEFWKALERDPRCFECHRNRGRNESQGRIVPISFTTKATYTKRFFLHLDGACEKVDFNVVFLPYGQPAMNQAS